MARAGAPDKISVAAAQLSQLRAVVSEIEDQTESLNQRLSVVSSPRPVEAKDSNPTGQVSAAIPAYFYELEVVATRLSRILSQIVDMNGRLEV
jgi:hypothetical protein